MVCDEFSIASLLIKTLFMEAGKVSASAAVMPAEYCIKSLTSATDFAGVSIALPLAVSAIIALLGDLPASILPLVTSDFVFSSGLGTLLSSQHRSHLLQKVLTYTTRCLIVGSTAPLHN